MEEENQCSTGHLHDNNVVVVVWWCDLTTANVFY